MNAVRESHAGGNALTILRGKAARLELASQLRRPSVGGENVILRSQCAACDRTATREVFLSEVALLPHEPDEESKEGPARKVWLASATGVNFVGIGVAATVIALSVLTADDIWFLSTGEHLFTGLRLWGFYLPLAGLSAVFCAATFFLWRPILPKIMATLTSAAMASHVYQRLVAISLSHLKVLSLCRLLLCMGLVYSLFRYRTSVNQE
jgi:hypothetical protein